MFDFKAGDVCRYSFGGKNKSDCTVEIVRILDDPRGIAEAKFLAVKMRKNLVVLAEEEG